MQQSRKVPRNLILARQHYQFLPDELRGCCRFEWIRIQTQRCERDRSLHWPPLETSNPTRHRLAVGICPPPLDNGATEALKMLRHIHAFKTDLGCPRFDCRRLLGRVSTWLPAPPNETILRCEQVDFPDSCCKQAFTLRTPVVSVNGMLRQLSRGHGSKVDHCTGSLRRARSEE